MNIGSTGKVLLLTLPFYLQRRQNNGFGQRYGHKESVQMPLDRLQKLSVSLVEWGDRVGYNVLAVDIVGDDLIEIRIGKGKEDKPEVIFECICRNVLLCNSVDEDIVIGDEEEVEQLADALRKEIHEECTKQGWPYASSWSEVKNGILFTCTFAQVIESKRVGGVITNEYVPVTLYSEDKTLIEEALTTYTDGTLKVVNVVFKRYVVDIMLEFVESVENNDVVKAIKTITTYLTSKTVYCWKYREIGFYIIPETSTASDKKVYKVLSSKRQWEVVNSRLLIYYVYHVGYKYGTTPVFYLIYTPTQPRNEELTWLKETYNGYQGEGYKIEKCMYNYKSSTIVLVIYPQTLSNPELLVNTVTKQVSIPFAYPVNNRFIKLQLV